MLAEARGFFLAVPFDLQRNGIILPRLVYEEAVAQEGVVFYSRSPSCRAEGLEFAPRTA